MAVSSEEEYHHFTDSTETESDQLDETPHSSLEIASLHKDLARWATSTNQTHKAVNKLLYVVRRHGHRLSKDARSLLETPQGVPVQNKCKGQYIYYVTLKKNNIISDKDFKSSNAVFKSVLKCYRKNGKDTSVHHPRITESDLEKIRNAPALSSFTPTGLVRKVWFDIQLCFARSGREGNRNLSKEYFVLRQDENGKEYLTLAHNPETKNHKDPTASDRENLRGFMFASPGDPLCPVDSFKKYLSKCPENARAFYLHPRRIPLCNLKGTEVWFTREPMGLNYLGNMLKHICEEVEGISQMYTSHNLRSTAVGRLSDAGIESRQIMSVTGHRCEGSLRSYWAPSLSERIPEEKKI
nr:uncharacterized protein LOC129413436 [Misgurnus anguillicaudatus]